MIFEHIETGLQILVFEVESKREEVNAKGEIIEFIDRKELKTESGQPCEPWGNDDVHQLLSIRVITRTREIRLFRVKEE
jgi:hypothetical protein